MLGKLLKYEFHATARYMLPMYCAALALALLTRLFLTVSGLEQLENLFLLPAAGVSFMFLFFLLALDVLTLVVIIQRFYKNLMCDEGYLMFTLPLTPTHLICAKLIAAVVWTLAAGLISAIGLAGAFLDVPLAMDLFAGIKEIFFDVFTTPAAVGHVWLYALEILATAFAGLLLNILMMYASMAIGQLFNRFKLAASFGAYFAITTVLQMLSTLGMVLLCIPAVLDSFSAMEALINLLDTHWWWVMHGSVLCGLLLNLLGCVIFYLTTDILLRRKLNLA